MPTLRSLALVLALLAAGCGGESEDGGAPQSGVEFTRDDGSAVAFPSELRAWCGPYDEDNADVEGVHVLAGSFPNGEDAEPFWLLRGVRADIDPDGETTLPNDFVYTEPRGASLFALDDAEHGQNELSSASERSAGTIRVALSGCEPGDTVEVTFDDVTLGSEFGDGESMSVEGAVTAEVGEAPE